MDARELEIDVITNGSRESFSKLIDIEENKNFTFILNLISMTDRHVGPMLLWDVMNKKDLFLKPIEIWELIREVWTSAENNNWGLNQEFWGNMLTRYPPIDSLREDLPNEFICYRGGYKGGFSFTLDKEKAIWFRDRWGISNPEHNLFERKTSRDDVLFYSNEREEKEVVIFPHKAKWDLVEIG